MSIIQLLDLVADQNEMISTNEDELDQVVSDVLSHTHALSDDDLEDIRAAALPFVPNHEKTDM